MNESDTGYDYSYREVEVNGVLMRVRDIAALNPDVAAQFGFGHFTYDIQTSEVNPGTWPYTPTTCLTDSFQEPGRAPQGVWNDEGTRLSCPGCGLDGT